MRVAQGTLVGYLTAILPFVFHINTHYVGLGYVLTAELLAYAAGEYCAVRLADGQVRPFHAALKFFFPSIDRSRVTAELKGVEKSTTRNPTTPLTMPMLVALAMFTRQRKGLAAAVGIIVGFFGLLRTAELHKIKRLDVTLRCGYIALTTIRLSTTKNGRQEIIQFEPNSLAERALKLLLSHGNISDTAPLFGFRSYSELYKLFMEFRLHFKLIAHLTPHSLRAGGATDLKLRGWPSMHIADIGRWSDIRTCKGYIDVVFTLLPETRLAEAHLYPTDEAALAVLCALPW